MKQNRLALLLPLLLLPLFFFGSCAKKIANPAAKPAPPMTLAISHNASLESPWQKASLKFAEVVSRKSGGNFTVEVFGNGVLFQRNWQVLLDMCTSGSTHIGIESGSALGSKVEEVALLSLPFLFNDVDHVKRFMDSDLGLWNAWIKRGFEKKNLVMIAMAPRPFRQLSNNQRLIKTPADIKGMKLRVPSNEFFVRVFDLLDAKPVPLPSGEIYSAIQMGMVAGEDNSISVQYDFKTYEVAKKFTIWNYMADASFMFMNKDVYNKLNNDQKALLAEAGEEWVKVNMIEDELMTAKARTEMEKAGVVFYEMTEAEKAPFKKILAPVYTEFARKVAPEAWKSFMDMVEKTRKK